MGVTAQRRIYDVTPREIVDALIENDDFDPKEFAMDRLYDQPVHNGDIAGRDGQPIRRSRNMAGIRRHVGRNVVDFVNIWPLGDAPHPSGGLEIRFRDGASYRTRFESYSLLKHVLRTWRNLYGAPLRITNQDSGKVSYRNPALVEE